VELLTLTIQALAVAWVVFISALGVAATRRALAGRRRRRAYWRRLVRSYRGSLDTLGPITWADHE